MKTFKNNKVLMLLFCITLGLFQGCKKEVNLKISKEITFVDFANVSNEVLKVDEAKGIVWVNVPWQNSWTLKAFISHTGVKIEPYDTQIRDYTKPVTFTITAEDGSTKDYTLIVTSAKAQLNLSPTILRNQDLDFHKFSQAKISNESFVGAGKTFLIIYVGSVGDLGRKNNFGFEVYVPSSGLIDGKPYFLGNFNVGATTGGPRVVTYLNEISGVYDLLSTATYYVPNWAEGNITIDNYDITFKLVSGSCRNLAARNLNSGNFYTNGSCSFLNVPVK